MSVVYEYAHVYIVHHLINSRIMYKNTNLPRDKYVSIQADHIIRQIM